MMDHALFTPEIWGNATRAIPFRTRKGATMIAIWSFRRLPIGLHALASCHR
jgi:hypothetical protein